MIEDGICAEICLLEEDEMQEFLADILDNKEMSPEERAERLAEPGQGAESIIRAGEK